MRKRIGLFRGGVHADACAVYARAMSTDSGRADGRGVLRAIAVYKIVKSALLCCVVAVALELVDAGRLHAFVEYLRQLPLAEGHHLLRACLEPVVAMTVGEVEVAGLVAAFYALLFGIEGYGLWRGRHWAEWFTLVATASLVPLEAWAFFDSPTALRAAALLLNLAIVGVLFVLLRRQRRRRAGAGGVR